MLLEKLRYNFFFRLFASAAILLLLWTPISKLYLHGITPIANAFIYLIGTPVKLVIIDDILRFQYPSITSQFLQFSVNEVDQIFLNIVVFVTLTFSAYKIEVKKRTKFLFTGLGVLLLIHIFVFYMYAYTTIWDHVLSLSDNTAPVVRAEVERYFSQGIANFFQTLLFNWNSWGWDVVPILIWLPVGFHQFGAQFLQKKSRKKSSRAKAD